jgi:hypothetical protein
MTADVRKLVGPGRVRSGPPKRNLASWRASAVLVADIAAARQKPARDRRCPRRANLRVARQTAECEPADYTIKA